MNQAVEANILAYIGREQQAKEQQARKVAQQQKALTMN